MGCAGLSISRGTAPGFVAAVEDALGEDAAVRIRHADAFLAQESWEGTWDRMHRLIEEVLDAATDEEDRLDISAVATLTD